MPVSIFAALQAAASLAAASPAARVEDLGWMSGRWETASGDRWTEEAWSVPRGGMMIGFSRSGQGERPREFEFIRLAAGPDGVPVYLAQPGGGPVVAFRLVEADSSSAAFANPEHDYPQRVRYAREGDTLVATISAADGSNARSWTYRRQ